MDTNRRLITLENVTKQYGSRKVLDGLDLQINEGDLITIMGHSGAGKSTLLNILGFFEEMTEGEYFFDGKRVEKKERSRLRNLNLGFVFQSYNLIPKMTAYENVVLPIYYSLSKESDKKKWLNRVPELLNRYRIKEIEREYVDHISGGEKQRVCLARALSCDARLLICDEPTGNLDKENTLIILEELVRLNNEGKTIVIVTHDELVQNIAKRKMLLQEGKLVEKYEV